MSKKMPGSAHTKNFLISDLWLILLSKKSIGVFQK